MKSGKFITLEGTEGSGKSTQIRLLERYLKKCGYNVYSTREPGGTKIGDQVRALLLDRKNSEMTPMTETFLYMAARAQLVSQEIRPRLKKGQIVLCDRWLDATLAYQGYAAGVDLKFIASSGRQATGNLQPDVSLFLDLPVTLGFKRIRHRKPDRMELKKIVFHEKVRRGYLEIAKKEPRRFRRIPVGEKDSVEAVHKKILEIVSDALRRR